MRSLDEVLRLYAAAAPVGNDELIELVEAARIDDRDVLVDLISDRAPAGLSVGDWVAREKGQYDLACDLFKSAVRFPTTDPEELAQVGRFLLERAGTPLAPIHPGELDLDPWWGIPADGAFEVRPGAFPADYAGLLIELGTESFARTLLLLRENSVPWDFTQELLALDGFMCGLVLRNATDDLEPAIERMHLLVADLGVDPDLSDIAAIFRERALRESWWLRGRRGQMPWGTDGAVFWDEREVADPALDSDVQTRRLLWQLRELVAELPASVVEAIRTEGSRIDFRALDAQLRTEHGVKWDGLDSRVRRCLCQAEYLRPLFVNQPDVDWSSVVVHYGRALEVALQRMLRGQLLRRVDPKNAASVEADSASWTIGDFAIALQQAANGGKQSLGNPKAARDLSKALKQFAEDYRNPAAHGDEFFSPGRAREARDALMGEEGLIWRVQQFHLG